MLNQKTLEGLQKGDVNMTSILNIQKALIQKETFALLVIESQDGEIVLRPIGGDYGCNITEAAKELDTQYPGCKMRLYEHNYDSWKRYFEGELPKEQLIL